MTSKPNLATGEEFTDLAGLRKLLVKQTALVRRNYVSKLVVQATGRIEDARDAADVMKILSDAKQSPGMRELLHQVIASDAFRR